MNSSKKIVFFETTKEEKVQILSLMGDSIGEADAVFFEQKLNSKNLSPIAKSVHAISVFVNSDVSKNIIDLFPNLKFISTRSTGFDHIDVSYAKSKSIQVSNVPSYGSKTVAEFTFALMLDLARKVSDANRQIRQGGGFDTARFRGFDLSGKTLGVIGTGRIGKHVIRIAKGFDMNVAAFDVFPDQKFADEYDFKYGPLENVLSQSDIVTLHTPYNKETLHLINSDNIKFFKKGAYLINTARGEIVDTKALLWALKEKIIAGAGLDVLEGERKLKGEAELLDSAEDFKLLLEDHMLMDMLNVIVTPHIAFASKEAQEEILKITAENISAFMSGSPKNTV